MILNIKWKVLVKRNNAQAQTIVHTHTHKQKMSLAKTYSNRVYIVKRVTSYCIAICNNLLSMWQMMLVNTRFKSRIFNGIARESRCDVFMRSNSTLKTVRQINEMSSRPTNRKQNRTAFNLVPNRTMSNNHFLLCHIAFALLFG